MMKNSIDLMIFEQLSQFRQELYEQLGKAKDAVFELMNAALTSISPASFVSLSQSPVFRRQWSSIYAALHDSRLPQAKLMQAIAKRVDTTEQPILAGDRTFWSRQDAVTLKERIFDHDSRQKSAVGQSYSTLAWIPEESGSWALPLRHERISSFKTPGQRAAFQLQQVSRQLNSRPLAVYDRGYGNASFVNQTAAVEADLLLRLAANRCVFGAPPTYGGRGAPRKHGVKFKFKDPTSWPEVSETLEVDDPQYGRVRLLRWSNFHFKQSPQRDMEIIRVEVLHPSVVSASFKCFGSLLRLDHASLTGALAGLPASLCPRTLVSLDQAATTLDTTPTEFQSSPRALEPIGGTHELAVVAGSP